MELIVIANSSRRINLRLHPLLLIIILISVLFCIVGAFYSGARYGTEQSVSHINGLYDQAGRVWSKEIEEQRVILQQAREDAEKHLDAMAARLSNLQGHVMRLNFLGSRLAHMAKLDDIAFDIENTPGMGGPAPSENQSSYTVPDFLHAMDNLALEIEDRGDKLMAMESMLINSKLQAQTIPGGRPIQTGWLSSPFGWRSDPITGKREFHEGLDFAGKPGSLITAVGGGIVTWSGARYGYGNTVEINHGNGYITRYAHNKQNLVIVGQKVAKGEVIAVMGSSGRSTGSHVHFEVIQNGKHVNPKKFIAEYK